MRRMGPSSATQLVALPDVGHSMAAAEWSSISSNVIKTNGKDPLTSPSLENKSNNKISMTKHDVGAFAWLCEPLRTMSDVLVIPDEGGHNVSATYESFPPRKPPGKSPEACQMMSKKRHKIRKDVEALDALS